MNDHEFKDVINQLELLKSVQADEDFKKRMKKKVLAFSPNRFAMPVFSLRVAMIVFAVLMSGATLVGAAEKSQPGDAFYSLKEVLNSVRTNFGAERELSKAPTPEFKKVIPTTTPEPTVPNPTPTTAVQKQLPPRTEAINQLPTATPTVAPTAVPDKQGVLPAVKGTVDHAVDKLPIKLQIGGSSEPTSTPKPNNVGSKDNGSNAGAGGSLLPKIKIGL